MIRPHRWSGWPGAFCLDCGVPDPIEECIASECGVWTDCDCVRGLSDTGERCENCCGTGVLKHTNCPKHQPTECPREADP